MIEKIDCNSKSEFIIHFKSNETTEEGNATVTISIEDLPVLKFDVLLYGMPFSTAHGNEVTMNWHTDIKNKGIFHTDSNGLEMQRR